MNRKDLIIAVTSAVFAVLSASFVSAYLTDKANTMTAQQCIAAMLR